MFTGASATILSNDLVSLKIRKVDNLEWLKKRHHTYGARFGQDTHTINEISERMF